MANAATLTLRVASEADVITLEALIATSARALGRGFYTDSETEAAIVHVFGIDSALITDRSYFVAESEGVIAGCGGWSARRTLFGGDRFVARDDGMIDPTADAARIRAFFVAPRFARCGVGAALLVACEAAARAAGFTRAALMATLPGVPFYAARGYVIVGETAHDCGGIAVRFVAMSRDLLQ